MPFAVIMTVTRPVSVWDSCNEDLKSAKSRSKEDIIEEEIEQRRQAMK
jgi:hypothetical protein